MGKEHKPSSAPPIKTNTPDLHGSYFLQAMHWLLQAEREVPVIGHQKRGVTFVLWLTSALLSGGGIALHIEGLGSGELQWASSVLLYVR